MEVAYTCAKCGQRVKEKEEDFTNNQMCPDCKQLYLGIKLIQEKVKKCREPRHQ